MQNVLSAWQDGSSPWGPKKTNFSNQFMNPQQNRFALPPTRQPPQPGPSPPQFGPVGQAQDTAQPGQVPTRAPQMGIPPQPQVGQAPQAGMDAAERNREMYRQQGIEANRRLYAQGNAAGAYAGGTPTSQYSPYLQQGGYGMGYGPMQMPPGGVTGGFSGQYMPQYNPNQQFNPFAGMMGGMFGGGYYGY